jgi:hypothetical protein
VKPLPHLSMIDVSNKLYIIQYPVTLIQDILASPSLKYVGGRGVFVIRST